MSIIKAVIFDLDGTLGNTLPLSIKAFKHSSEPLIGRSVSDDEIVATFGPSEEGTVMALAPDYFEKGMADYLFHYRAYHNLCPDPFEGIREILDTLKNKSIRLALVTGKGMDTTSITLKKFKLEHYFEIIETGSPEGSRKPEAILTVLDVFGNMPGSETIYVGDAPSDIHTSRKAGVPIVSAAWAATANKEALLSLKPDQIFYTIPDFREWLFEKI